MYEDVSTAGPSLSGAERALDEADSKALLRALGAPVVEGGVAGSEEEAVTLAREVGLPVVMKGVSAEHLHKTEAGLVMLDVRTEVDVRNGFRRLAQAGDKAGGEVGGETGGRVLVERSVRVLAKMAEYEAFHSGM